MVEAAVRNFVGEEKIAKNVNADEAAVMGASNTPSSEDLLFSRADRLYLPYDL